MVILKDVHTVLFDAVGTLIEADPAVAEVYHHFGSQFGSQLSVSQISLRFRMALEQSTDDDQGLSSQQLERERWRRIVEVVFCDVDQNQDQLFESLWEYFARGESWRLYDDVADAWRSLQDLDLRLAIASNFDDRILQVVSKHPPLDQCQHVYYSANLGFTKPSCSYFETIAQRLQSPPGQLLMVGDHPVHDVWGPRQAGWQAILLERDHHLKDSDPNDPLRITDLQQLRALLAV